MITEQKKQELIEIGFREFLGDLSLVLEDGWGVLIDVKDRKIRIDKYKTSLVFKFDFKSVEQVKRKVQGLKMLIP